MKKNIAVAVVAVVAVLGGIAAYFLMKPTPPAPAPVQVQAPPPPPKPEVRQVIEALPAPPPLPALGESDKFMLDALAGLVGDKSLMKVFRTERIIRNIVATIDNLPQRRAPMNVMPIERAKGWLVTSGKENGLTISPKNAERYAPYMKVAGAIDAKKLVGLYVRLYPLFQQAYEELGYPKKYFNDRLIVALDDLLAAPDQAHAEGLFALHALCRHVEIALLEDAQGHRSAGEKHRLEREERDFEALFRRRRALPPGPQPAEEAHSPPQRGISAWSMPRWSRMRATTKSTSACTVCGW